MTMNTKRNLIAGSIAAIAGGAIIVALGLSAGAVNGSPVPESTFEPETTILTGEIGEPFEKPAVVTPAVEIPLDDTAAPVEEEAPAPAPAPAPQPAPAPAPAPAPPAPVLCPAGSSANSSDGYNDTSCMWDVCFTISVPDPAHPECDSAFRP